MRQGSFARWQLAREIAGVPFVINSGWRCREHNAEVEGSPASSHMAGRAGDVKVTDSEHRYRVFYGLKAAGFTRLGIYNNFIHADDDTSKQQGVLWVI